MGFITRLLIAMVRLLTFPFRMVGRLFGSSTATTARKAAGGVATMELAIKEAMQDAPEVTTSFPFRALDRPKLTEQSAADLTLEVAESYVSRANRFYNFQFDLFPRSSLFYEEVELAEVSHALAADDPNSTDSRFVIWMDLFRRTLNDNARRLLMVYSPILHGLFLLGAIMLLRRWPTVSGIPFFESETIPATYVVMPAMTTIGLLALVLIYQWPFKVVTQRNLLGLDNYITSRFSRISQNFQVAKRFALNVERNKRMSQSAELKYEAGVWTVAYNWFAIRLFLCERVVRNQMYQVARNATLYSLGGIFLSLVVAGGFLFAWMTFWPVQGDPMQTYGVFAIGAFVHILVAYMMIVGGTAGEAARVLSENEWFRFGAAELDRTIADHVGEDKLQIVTFRDRNRIE